MSKDSNSEPVSQLVILQQRISTATWLVTLLLSLRGLYAFYGMKEKGPFEQIITYVTEPLVALFNFNFLRNLEDIPGIGVLFATISLLVISYTVQIFIHFTHMWTTRTQRAAVHYVISAQRLKRT